MKYDNDKLMVSMILSVCAIPVALIPIVFIVLPEVDLISQSNSVLGAAALMCAGAMYCVMGVGFVRLLGVAKFYHVPLVSRSRIPVHALATDEFETANDLETHRLYKASDVVRGTWDTSSPFHETYK